MPAEGGEGAAGATTVVIPDVFTLKNDRKKFVEDTAAKIFANIDFKTVGKSIKECAEESVSKAETLADILGIA